MVFLFSPELANSLLSLPLLPSGRNSPCSLRLVSRPKTKGVILS